MKLEGKVAIVTGGGAGIGRGIVHCLAEEGADVAILEINKETAKKVADEVKALGRKSLAVVANVTDSKEVDQAVKKVMKTFGKIDILVNNVGKGSAEITVGDFNPTAEDWERAYSGGIAELTEGDWDRGYAANLKTTVLMCKAVIPYMRAQKSGKIVNISSGAGRRGSARRLPYSTMKSAVIILTQGVAHDLARDNINVNCICPGIVDTGIFGSMRANPEFKGMTPKEYHEKYTVSRIPLRRLQTAEDMGRAVVFFVSEDAKNITGQTLNIDGGSRMD